MIRPPQSPSEWEEVRNMLIAYKREFDDDTCFTSFEEEIRDIMAYYETNDRIKRIAVRIPGEELVGCVALRALSKEVAEMKRLYVKPEYRGNRIGRELAEIIIDMARKMGFQKMVLDTMMEMKTAQQLYLQLGFYPIPPYRNQDPAKVICFEITLIPDES
jgi:ribosomal protein S18 acetylase RimI-like enzyme